MYYYLKDKTVHSTTDVKEWSKVYRKERIVKRQELGPWLISTVFLALDHSFGDGPPLLFETMVFPNGDWGDLECERYATYEEAEKGHDAMVAKWREKLAQISA